MPEFIAKTIIGIEDVAAMEIKEFLGSDSVNQPAGRLLFKATEEEAKRLVYFSRSLDKVYLLLSRFSFTSLDDIISNLESFKFNIAGTFAVRCHRDGSHDFMSKDVERSVGGIIFKQGFKVSLEDPGTLVYVDIIDEECFVGIDFSVKPMHKRDYRIKAHNQSANACLAYAMVRLSGYKPGMIFLDPFCKDGTVAIEAACFASRIPRGYYSKDKPFDDIDKNIDRGVSGIFAYDPLFHNIRSCEINCKLAGVNKTVKLGRFDIEWLDTKVGEDAVDCLVTSPPFVSRSTSEKDVSKLYKELFHQLEYIMRPGSRLVALAPNLIMFKEYAESSFKLVEDRTVSVGAMDYTLLILERM